MFRKTYDVLLIILLTVFAIAAVISGIPGIFRVAFALVLVFVFPGYALVSAMFSKTPFRLETYLVFAIALSIAVTVLSGLILHFTPWGLQPITWLLLLSVITLFASAIAIIRRSFAPTFEGVEIPLSFNWSQVGLLGLAVVVTFAAFTVARNGVFTQVRDGFTQFWILPPTSGTPEIVEIGIRNEEKGNISYRLIVNDSDGVLGEWDSIELLPGEQWDYKLTIQPTDDQIDAQLYRNDSPDSVYRSVSLALGSQSSSP